MATIKIKLTDYRNVRKHPNGETYERAINNVSLGNVYNCIKTQYVINHHEDCYVTLSFDLMTNTYYYNVKCYTGNYNF